jgi:GTP cyclohydrolase IA
MKEPNVSTVAEHYAAILKELGADLDAEGMRETPMRAAKALVDMTEGSRIDTAALTKQFKSECNDAVCHDMVIVEGIHQVGLCEHHVLPIPHERHNRICSGQEDPRIVQAGAHRGILLPQTPESGADGSPERFRRALP